VPFALTETGAQGVRIAAAGRAARAAGVAPGLTLADARARAPDLVSEEIDRAADTAALEALGLWMIRWAPVVALDGADALMLDATGCAHLWGGETAYLGAISTRLDRAGIGHRLALAETPGAAWALAHVGSARLARLEGPAAGGLADLPVAGLRLSAEALTLLRRLGLTRIGQLLDLDRVALARRFRSAEAAEHVLLRLDQALGRRAEPLRPLHPPAAFTVRLACPEPLGDADGIRAGLARLVARLAADLEAAGQGGRCFRLAAYRGDGGHAAVEATAVLPVRDPDHLMRLFRDRLAAIDPGHGIEALTLEAGAVAGMDCAPRALAPDLAARPVDPAALAALADRITARLGPGRVGVLRPVERHLPERTEHALAFPGRLASWGGAGMPGAGPRPLRILTPPEPVEVLAEVPDGPPLRFVWRRVQCRAVRAEGPERIAPEWWRAGGTAPTGSLAPGAAAARPDRPTHPPAGAVPPARARDYYRVEDGEGRRYWLYREGLFGDGRGGWPRWFLAGLFA